MDSDTPVQRERIFETLLFLNDLIPRPVQLQMAVDEVLLESVQLPILRVYRWESPCVTIGYFQSHSLAMAAHPGLAVVRRWTGGGLVLHGMDAPYSLIVPGGEPFAAVRPAASYRAIHGALAEALRGRLAEVTLAEEDAPKQSAACFENPVSADLLCRGAKVGGAGQRRTRRGLLHQGSLQLGGAPFDDARAFAGRLAKEVRDYDLPLEILSLAERLVPTRYGRAGWNCGRL